MDDTSTLGAARARYLAAAGLGDGGYDDPLVRLRFGRLVVDLPNTTGRRKAVPLHDLHHVLTGYPAGNWQGEFAISAWEIATGCGRFITGWAIDLGGLAAGALVYPRTTFAAFVRGRRSHSLYREYPQGPTPELLAQPVALVQTRLHLDRAVAPATGGDALRFACWLVIALPAIVIHFAAALVLGPLLWLAGPLLRRRARVRSFRGSHR